VRERVTAAWRGNNRYCSWEFSAAHFVFTAHQRFGAVDFEEDILNSLLGAIFFPVCNKKFPASIGREFVQSSLVFQWVCASGEGRFNGNFPVFSCGSGNFRQRRLVRCSLSAQPPSRAFSALPRRSECSAPELPPPIGGGSLSRDLIERVSAEERRFLPGLSLRADFRGHLVWSFRSA
jgi:hypothetical protein